MIDESKKTSKTLLNELLDKHYAGALEAKAAGRPVVWATSICPQELLETMGLTTVYPENHAAAIGARKCASEFIQESEGKGYSADICSYARVNIGYAEIKETTAGNIPMPDLLFCCSNICNTAIKWYENLSATLDIPLIMFDMPFNHTVDIPAHSIAYMRGQIEHAIAQLEAFTGKEFDHDKFGEVMEISNQTCEWWKKATDLAKAHPSPLNGFDMFNYMAIIVCMRGNKDGRDVFHLWHDELKEKIANGLGPWKEGEEKYRIMWDGIACWPHLSATYKALKNNGVNMVTSTYPESWNVRYEKNDLDGMARAYSANYANRNLDYGTGNVIKLVEDFDLEGIVFHLNRSCKLMDFRQFEVQRRVENATGIPSVIFDGDQTDPRIFSEGQYETRIQALIEMMEQRKQSRRAG
ncbi:MAG: 2-hydroxyacyl-CoA dehydratase family protein [Clostridiales Family XIII bacterium]|jgi:benzoyl-CoA reductase/2-hydroxyglutaryl-CoA dehydratase subunit BcrC/BadD/HgdB|nr:2-hydroxyacyl-CoA dehydratase family protein [Clostridiales Family XIII bacterium]